VSTCAGIIGRQSIFTYFYGASTRFRVMTSHYRAFLSHSDTPHSAGYLWTSAQHDAQTSILQHTLLTRFRLPSGGIRTHNHSKLTSANPRQRPRGYCDRLYTYLVYIIQSVYVFILRERGSSVSWGTALQAGRSRVRFPMGSVECFIGIILPVVLWPWGRLSL
jgi:hypothetical protein